MSSKTLQMIAEIKMHLRDSHAASWSQKQQSRSKRQFGLPTGIRGPESSLPATPNSTVSIVPPPVTPDRDNETENNLHPIGFREMIENFNSLAEDGMDFDLGDASAYVWGSRSICDLFDFTSNYWIKEHRKKSSNPLDEERNFYETLSSHDIDAAAIEESQFCDYH